MHTVPAGWCVTLASLSLSACSDQLVCPAFDPPAVEVEVRDADSDDFIASITTGVARDGTFEDFLRPVGFTGNDPALATTLGGADGRPGTYEVRLEADGYSPWDTAGIAVAFDGCSVTTLRFTARLARVAVMH